jgi:hypothetical protein
MLESRTTFEAWYFQQKTGISSTRVEVLGSADSSTGEARCFYFVIKMRMIVWAFGMS